MGIINPKSFETEIDDAWKNHLKHNKIENQDNKKIVIEAGEYHGYKVSVAVQVLGPLNKGDIL